MGTSTTPADSLLLIIVAIVAVPFLIGVRRRRESIRRKLRNGFITEAAYLGVAWLLVKAGQPPMIALLAGVVAGLLVITSIRPRSRYIPASVRRRARAEFELRTGEKFNPRKHEYDHKVPFSRGGSHTSDNIRVVERGKNRSKGKRAPWWGE